MRCTTVVCVEALLVVLTCTGQVALGFLRPSTSTSPFSFRSPQTVLHQSSSPRVDDASEATACSSNSSSCPMLRLVPTVPILGSFFPPLTGIPLPNRRYPNRFNVEMSKQFGEFYRMGVPTFGKDIAPDLYVIQDPREMRTIVQSQPANDAVPAKYRYPVGIVEQQWPFLDYFRSHNATTADMFTRGPQWWEARQAVQAGLAVPPPLSAIVHGAVLASHRLSSAIGKNEGEESWTPLPKEFVEHLNRAAFDMFEQVVFGSSVNDKSSDELFEATLSAMLQAQALRRSPLQSLARKLSMTTSAMRECYGNLDTALSILKALVDDMDVRLKSGTNTADDREDCYVLRNLQVQGNKDAVVPRRDLPHTCLALLLGAVDTTAGKIGWNLLQLAFHPDIQQQLLQEIRSVTAGQRNITTAVLDKAQTPLLHGVIRETHRVTPAVTVNLIKDALCPVTIHNVSFPRQTAVMLDSTTPQLRLVEQTGEDPWNYDPSRWFPDAVQARKEQTEALLDHPYLAQPFGQGIRRCPGAAVALAEVHAFVAQFVLDWEVTVTKSLHYREVASIMQTGPVPDFPAEMQIRRRSSG